MAGLSLAAIAAAVGGRLETRGADGGRRAAGYSIDSRTVTTGDLFFAIAGPRHDGHAFVDAAMARGALAAVVRQGSGPFSGSPALVRVNDTTVALQELASSVRRFWGGGPRRGSGALKVVGITGSAGKTTAKDLTAEVCARRFRTARTAGNLNNAYGLPLSLLRLPDDTEVAVLEMGMSTPGEIATLTRIADPDIGVILGVLPVHLGNFRDLEEIAAAKGELFRDMRHDAAAVFNADEPHAAALGRAFPGPRLAYGIEARDADVRAEDVVVDGLAAVRFTLRSGGETVPVRLPLPGRHNVLNALAAAAVGVRLGIDLAAIRDGLEAARPAAMRGVLHRLAAGIELLDDSYNSNPAAMARAIDLLAAARPAAGGRRVLVSGDMLEIGPTEEEEHARVGAAAARAGIDLFFAVGALSRAAAEAARRAGLRAVEHAPSSEEAAPRVAAALRPGDLVLVKGSRGARMERVVGAVLAAHGGRPDPAGPGDH